MRHDVDEIESLPMGALVAMGQTLLDEMRAARGLPMTDPTRAARWAEAERQFRALMAEANRRGGAPCTL